MATDARSLGPRAEDERFRLLIEAVTDYAIYMLDPHGTVASWNAGAQRFKGYTQDEIVGEHFSRFYTEEDRRSGLPGRALETAAKEERFEQEGWRDEITRHSAWDRMSAAGVQVMTWFGVACEFHGDWRNDIEGLGTLFSNHIPDYRNLITAYTTVKSAK